MRNHADLIEQHFLLFIDPRQTEFTIVIFIHYNSQFPILVADEDDLN